MIALELGPVDNILYFKTGIHLACPWPLYKHGWFPGRNISGLGLTH